ncbi:splicing regulatory glutamine/lysine-rich protein 1 isoform X2 [Chanos chanos]|uniref:Splicing regulatory glutamine/lysine-rich protein 1 n=1 Tax=Chanos chanos TaxID=29144 RepID=A0A6J2UUS6_CHACN|nr:splicing regulatory glutamine/lysine-rich protein 1 isoform X2 [Chanos chanos]XP_030624265.1 splicing regulatory glutamine/lysine-rich protein 1 isoform X2 [Chanos chanos]
MVHDQYVSSTGKIPEEAKALSLLAPATPVTNLMPGGGLLPIPSPAPLQNLGLPIGNLGALQTGLDPSVTSLGGTSSQPPLMGNVDPSKIDEIRRTVYVGNLNSQTTTAEQLLEYFKQVGEVKFVRMAGDETQPTRFAFVEFADQESVARALTFNGVMFGDRPLKINHSNNAIVKPPEMTPQAAAKELEDVMKRVREAQSTIAAAIEPDSKKHSLRRSKRSPSASRSRSHSRSRSRSRRKRSHSKHRGRPSQRSRQKGGDLRSSHKRRSRSRDRRRSRSCSHSCSRDRRKVKDGKVRNKDDEWEKEDRRGRDKKGRTPPKSYGSSRRSCSTSRNHRKRSRSGSRSPRRKARSPSPNRGKKDKKREKARDESRERKERSLSRRKSCKDKEKHERKAKQVERDCDSEEKGRESEREASGSASEDTSPCTQHNGRYSTHGDEGEEPFTANATE